jgi:hypothetical protein
MTRKSYKLLIMQFRACHYGDSEFNTSWLHVKFVEDGVALSQDSFPQFLQVSQPIIIPSLLNTNLSLTPSIETKLRGFSP